MDDIRERESKVPTSPQSIHNSNRNSIQAAHNHICYKDMKIHIKG
jgi:hypothetical protein